MMRFWLSILILIASSLTAFEEKKSISVADTDEIFWETPKYLNKLNLEAAAAKTQCVYHLRRNNFIGDLIISLNMMSYMDGYSKIYKRAISKYQGREQLLTCLIPTLNCLWNDVIFLSPLHPYKHYEEYVRIGFTPRHLQFFKIPIEVLKEKRVTVWKSLSYKKYPIDDPIHDAIDSYCSIDFSHYQELEDLPDDTKELYRENFDPKNPEVYPQFNWYRIPHILCQDPIDLLDERITIINWEDPIDPFRN